jgi:hypothetical protein
MRPSIPMAIAVAVVTLSAGGWARADSNARAVELLSAESYSQPEAAALLLDASLSSENFVEIVKKSGGSGKVMETLSLLASSPGVVGSRFDELLEAVVAFPNSEAAEYLANNRYLTDQQVDKIGEAVTRNPDSRLALAFVRGGAAGSAELDSLVDLIVLGKAGIVSTVVAGSNGLTADSQKKLLFASGQNPDSDVARAFARNPFLNDDTMDSLGASAIKSPVGALAEGFSSNSGMKAPQMAALAQVAIEMPDSGVAAGIGSNRGLNSSTFSQFEPVVADNPYCRLSVALAGNPNLPDSIFATLSSAIDKDEVGEMSAALAGRGGAASNEVRAAELANMAISNANLSICEALIDNPAVPPAHLAALHQEAARVPGSALSSAFIEQIREKRFRGGRAEKMKILEAALMSGEVDSISNR